MVTGLVCIWSVDSETGVHKWQMGADGGGRGGEGGREMGEVGERSLQGGDVKSRFSWSEENISPFLRLTNALSQSAYPQLWEFHGISVIACLYLRNALSGLRALLISGGLDWLLSAEHTQ